MFLFDFSREVWENTYKYHTDVTIEDTWRRVAKELASIEKDSKKWEEDFYEALVDFKCVPGGRINSNAGTQLKGTTLINCYADGARGYDIDSIEGIFEAVTRTALILKSEGGYGANFSFMRPRGAFIHGVGVKTPGVVEFMNLWDSVSSVITKGDIDTSKKKKGKGKIRKGAMMGILDVSHPSIEEFVVAKQTPNTLTKFNLSVLCSKNFMKAVKEHSSWNLEFPETTFEKYKEEWDGNLSKWKSKKYPTNVYKTYQDANELWDIILESTYKKNEPGILFEDRINDLNNLHYCEYIRQTNACSEQPLPISGSCLLGSINLTQFINNDNTNWDYEKLSKYINIFIRMLDNVNDITIVPLPEQKESLLNKRRIGMGYLGYSSSLYLMKLRYGSSKAKIITEELCKFVTNEAYKSSTLLAKEKGSFPALNIEQYLKSNFIQHNLSIEVQNLIKKHGIRNSHLVSVQPTGNSSIYANNVSGGMEPIFLTDYIRTSTVNFLPEGLQLPLVDWINKNYISDLEWRWHKEGDETLLVLDYQGIIYKFDKNRGLVKETPIRDYSVQKLIEMNQWDPDAEWAIDTSKLSVDEHIDTMAIFARYSDASVSKTLNLRNDYPFEDFKNIYMKLYDSQVIKGGTTYRAGTMSSVLSSKSTKNEKEKISKTIAPKRPEELPCDVHRLTVNKQNWIVFIGLLGEDPYEVFAGLVDAVDISKKITKGKLIKIAKNKYSFVSEEVTINNIGKIFNQTEQSITRLVSTSLRHGVDIRFLTTQLQKAEEGLNSFSKALARTLKKYIEEGTKLDDQVCPICSKKNIVKSEGCSKCLDCGYSGCG